MAKPVDFRKFTPKNSRADLIERLNKAPEEHAEALLEVYELVQRMHEKGLINLANGLLSAGDTVVERVVDVASSPEAVNVLRIGLISSNFLNTIDADEVHAVLAPKNSKPLSLWKILRGVMSEDARAGMSAGLGLLKIFGAALRRQ